MTYTFMPIRLDRLLVSAVETLAAEFPQLPVGVVVRCIAAARAAVDPTAVEDLEGLAEAITEAARADLRYLAVSVVDVPAVPAG